MTFNIRTAALLGVMLLALAKVPNVDSSGFVLYANITITETEVKVASPGKDVAVTLPDIHREGTSLLDAGNSTSTPDAIEEMVPTLTSDKIKLRKNSVESLSSDPFPFESTGKNVSEKPDGNTLPHHRNHRNSHSHHSSKKHSHHVNGKQFLSHHDDNGKLVLSEEFDYNFVVNKMQDGGESTAPGSKKPEGDVRKEMNENQFSILQPFTPMNIPKYQFGPTFQFDFKDIANKLKQQHNAHEFDDIFDDRTDNFAIIFANVAQKILRIMILVCFIGGIVTLCRMNGCCKKKTEDPSEATPTTEYGQRNDDRERLVKEV